MASLQAHVSEVLTSSLQQLRVGLTAACPGVPVHPGPVLDLLGALPLQEASSDTGNLAGVYHIGW